ncbi:hypothetical protein C2G38_2197650 [Gigaspora rosea]|uniref:Uncharacterized protein n=1 Tax=Gigaspora rosea TaxID=44941 RepID=A0A397UTD6_9GLOM|nr:hypothetical protein C2G38_2197650 [Gigaspora rosea]
MSSQGSNNNSSKGAYDSYSTGTNTEGNHWCNRGPSEAKGDSSYYYQNRDGSTYYNDGRGNAAYTPPSQNPRTSR